MKNKKDMTQKDKKEKEPNSALGNLISLIGWITGIIVSLAVGFGLVDKVLKVRFLPTPFTVAVGWVVVILTIAGTLMAIFDNLSR